MEVEKVNLWEKVGNSCLAHALTLLEKGTDFGTVDTVKTLVELAISIDELNLRWEQSGYAGVWARTAVQKSEKI